MLTTVCASCGTEFRVTPDQLKIRDGRVRCGHCDSVFNALSTLTQRGDREKAADAPVGRAELVPAAPVASALTQIETMETLPADLAAIGNTVAAAREIIPTDLAVSEDTPVAASEIFPTDLAATDDAPPEPTQIIPAHPAVSTADLPWPQAIPEPPAVETATHWPSIDPVEFPAPEYPAQAPTAHATAAAVIPSIPKHQEFGFQTASQPAGTSPDFDFGPRPSTRRGWWWTPLAILFLCGLLAQAAFYFRGALAFLIPEAKPAINQICAELGCEVPLPRRAELISIESSDLQTDPTNPGVIVLLATLRNRAAFPQTFPALELTLTNERDQPLARRVLQFNDYLADKTEVFEGSSEKQIRLNLDAASLKASGYRLYLFYP